MSFISNPSDVKLVEVDFGTTPTTVGSFTITDASVTTGSNILVTQDGAAATSKVEDENEFEVFMFNVSPGSGSFTLRVFSMLGPVIDKFRISYLVG